jgi:hypothetical protein
LARPESSGPNFGPLRQFGSEALARPESSVQVPAVPQTLSYIRCILGAGSPGLPSSGEAGVYSFGVRFHLAFSEGRKFGVASYRRRENTSVPAQE